MAHIKALLGECREPYTGRAPRKRLFVVLPFRTIIAAGVEWGRALIQPIDYYRTGEWVAEKLSEVKETIDVVTKYATDHGGRVFWRGQANHTWGLLSSLVRKLVGATDIDDGILQRVEDALLSESSAWIDELKAGTYAEPLAKLAYLQHHGVPTRLLDFTEDPWMAIFFAAERHDHVDGRAFALIVPNVAVLAETPTGSPWKSYGQDEIKVYDPASHGIIFPRLKAQHGVFALGRLPSTQPYRVALDPVLGDKSRALLAEEVRRILSIPFALRPLAKMGEADRIPPGASLPLGLTFRIHIDKASVRRDLSGTGAGNRSSPPGTSVTHAAVYPDAAGMVANSKLLRGLDKGVLVLP